MNITHSGLSLEPSAAPSPGAAGSDWPLVAIGAAMVVLLVVLLAVVRIRRRRQRREASAYRAEVETLLRRIRDE